MIDVGMASVAISVVRQSRMNSRMVADTSTAASSRWNFTSSIDSRMNRDWSRMISVLMSGGRAVAIFANRALTSSDDLHRVGARLLLHEQADGVLAVQPAQTAGSSTESSARPMSRNADRVAVAIGDDQVVELVRARNPAQRPQHQFTRALVDDAARDLQVLSDQGQPDVLDRQPEGGKLVGVDDDVDRPAAAAREGHDADAGDRLQQFLDLVFGNLGHLAQIAPARDANRHDRERVEVDLD